MILRVSRDQRLTVGPLGSTVGAPEHAVARFRLGARWLVDLDVSDAPRRRAAACRVSVDCARLDAITNDLERKEVRLLFVQDRAEQVDVVIVELAITRRGALGFDEALTFEEPNLGDRDIGKVFEQQPEHLSDRQVLMVSHGATALARRRRDETCRPATRLPG